MNKHEQLLMAEHQLLGFFHAHYQNSLRDLVKGMGLTKDEFKSLIDNDAVSQISDDDIAEIHEILEE